MRRAIQVTVILSAVVTSSILAVRHFSLERQQIQQQATSDAAVTQQRPSDTQLQGEREPKRDIIDNQRCHPLHKGIIESLPQEFAFEGFPAEGSGPRRDHVDRLTFQADPEQMAKAAGRRQGGGEDHAPGEHHAAECDEVKQKDEVEAAADFLHFVQDLIGADGLDKIDDEEGTADE